MDGTGPVEGEEEVRWKELRRQAWEGLLQNSARAVDPTYLQYCTFDFDFDFAQVKPTTRPRERCGRAQLVLLPSLVESLHFGADL